MEKKFEDILKERFDTFEVKPPESVWKRLEADYSMSAASEKHMNSHRGVSRLWYWFIASMAVVAAFVFFPQTQTKQSKTKQALPAEQIAETNNTAVEHNEQKITSAATKVTALSPDNKSSKSNVLSGGNKGEETRTMDTTICGHYFVASINTHLVNAQWTCLSSQNVEIEHPENTETNVYFPASGTYVLVYGNESTGDSLIVTVKAVPAFTLADTSLCGNELLLPSGSAFLVVSGKASLEKNLLYVQKYGTVALQETQSIDGCTFVDTSQVVFLEPVDLEKISLKITDALCEQKGKIEIENSSEYNVMLNGKPMTGNIVRVDNGLYTLEVQNKTNHCSARQTITVKEKTVKPEFTSSKTTVTVGKPVYFTNLSKAINFSDDGASLVYHWDFGDGTVSNQKNPEHQYKKSGTYVVTLSVTQKSAQCTKTTQRKIVVNPLPQDIKVPNIFTPNNDNQNDVFYVNAGSLKQFKCEIFASSTGEKVAEFTDPVKGWDGKINHSNVDAPEGVYYYVITGIQKNGEKYIKKGSVRLVRH